MFSVNSVLDKCLHILSPEPVVVLEETECATGPFNEVTSYRHVVRVNGAIKGWQGTQGLAEMGSHYHS